MCISSNKNNYKQTIRTIQKSNQKPIISHHTVLNTHTQKYIHRYTQEKEKEELYNRKET